MRGICASGVLALALLSGVACAQPGALATQIAQHEQNLAQARSSKNIRQQVSEFNILGALYYSSGQLQKALDYLNQALPIEQKYSSLLGQATTLNTMGRVYTDLGQEDKALDLLNQALTFWRAIPSRGGEAETLNNMGKVYNNLGQHDAALKYLDQSLNIWREVNASTVNPSAGNTSPAPATSTPAPSFTATASINGEASTLDNLGRAWSDMGDGKQALDNFNQSLSMFRNLGERNGEALVLNDMGPAYAALGQKQKALDAYNQAIALWRELGNRQGEALTLNNIGRLCNDLGEHQTALDYYNQALPIWREVGNPSGQALALSDIGRAYADLGQPAKALDFQSQALPIYRQTGSRRGEAMVLNNLGRDHSDLGQAQQAYDLDLQALAIWREVKDQRDEAQDLMTIAWAYSLMKQPDLSFTSAIAALGLAKATADPQIDGNIENSIMIGFRKQNRPEEAIFFGLLAVNDYEQIRKNILGMDKEVQAGFAQSRSSAYRMLAELFVEAGRVGQAEQILDLLKEQELQDVVTTAAPTSSAGIEPLKLSPAQQDAEDALPDLEKKARIIEESSLAYAQLRAKPTRSPDEDTQLKTLSATIQQQGSDIQSVLTNKIFPELDAQSAPGQAPVDTTKSFLQDSLAKLGPRVMGIRLLLGEDHAYAVVVTANARKVVVLPASSADIRAKALEALKAVGSPSSDPRPQLNQLYSMVVAPIESNLKSLEFVSGPKGSVRAGAPTLLWSLDDALRYVPIGALYDGKQYLVERFHNVLFTPESYGHMTDSPLQAGTPPSALAMGLSKSYNGLPALPGVIPELDSIVHDPSDPASHGPMQGKLLPDEQFTLANLKSDLGAGNELLRRAHRQSLRPHCRQWRRAVPHDGRRQHRRSERI